MSNGPEFFQTVMGQRFFTSDVPRITDALEKIADKLDADNKNKPVFSDDQLDETWSGARRPSRSRKHRYSE